MKSRRFICWRTPSRLPPYSFTSIVMSPGRAGSAVAAVAAVAVALEAADVADVSEERADVSAWSCLFMGDISIFRRCAGR